jgi:hypothetical protein
MRIFILVMIALFAVGSLFSCKKNKQRENVVKIVLYTHSNTPIERKGSGQFVFDIDQVNKISEGASAYSLFYKRVSVIALETNEDCLIGEISQIRIFEPYMFVLDSRSAKNLFMFDQEGNFIRKFGNIGNGPGEYLLPLDFAIDRDNKMVYVLDGHLQRINKYDIVTGNFIHSIYLEKEIRSYQIEYIGGRLFADVFYRNHADDNYLLRVIQESSGKEESHYLNVMEYHQGISNMTGIPNQVFYFRENGNVVFVQRFMNHVIEISKDSVFSLIELKGKDFLLASDESIMLNEASPVQHSTIVRQLNKYHSIHGFIEKGDFIFIDVKQGVSLQKFMINKKTSELFALENFRDDLLFKDDGFYPVPILAFGCYDENGVYFYVVNSHFSSMYQSLAKAGALSPNIGGLEDLINLEEDANPIIFYYEFKD